MSTKNMTRQGSNRLGKDSYFDFVVRDIELPDYYRHSRLDILVNFDRAVWPSLFVYMGLNYSEKMNEVFLFILNELIKECKQENPNIEISSYGHFLRQGFSFHGDGLDPCIHLNMAVKLMEKLSEAFSVEKEVETV